MNGLTPLIGLIRMPATDATTAASSQLPSPSRDGDWPIRIAPLAFSAAARVASPNRVNRYRAATAEPISTTTATSQSRSVGRTLPCISMRRSGRIGSARSVAVPTCATAAPWSTIVRPTDATSRVTGGASRK